MRYVYRGVLLGAVLSLFIFCEQMPKENDCSVYIVSQEEETILPENVSITCKLTSYTNSSITSRQVTDFDVVCAYIHDNKFCQWYFDMTAHEIDRLMKVSYERIVSEILQLDHLSSKQMAELWYLYKRNCHRQGKVQECQKDLLTKLHQRLENYKKEQERKDKLEKQKLAEEKRLEQLYHADILSISDQHSSYSKDRRLALQKTKDQQYKKYKQIREIDEQTIGLCMAKNIDYQILQCSHGTAIQQQLYDEVADCYKKIAQWFFQPSFSESILANQSIEFAQCVSEATEAEAMQLAMALSDLAHGCIDIACWIVSESKEAIQDSVNNVTDPIGSACKVLDIAKNLGCCLGKVMNYVAEAIVYTDSESLGWSHYAQVLEQEHQYDGKYSQQVIDTMQDWIVHSSAQEKVRMGTRCVVDGVLYGNLCKLLSHTSKACCGLIADIPEFRFLGEFTDIYKEYGLVADFGEVGLTSLEKVGISLMESEVKLAVEKSEIFLDKTKSVIKNSKKSASKCKIFQDISVKDFKEKIKGSDKLIKIVENRRLFTKNGANGVANNVNGKKLLMKKLQFIEDFEQIAVKKRVLPDGRIRYYEMETPAATPGPTRSSGMVVEHDVKRGTVRAWYESRDHQGNVNRVNPKFFNGQEVFSQHYPPIAKDLKFFDVNPKKR